MLSFNADIQMLQIKLFDTILLAVLFFAGAIAEEVGWTGFVTDPALIVFIAKRNDKKAWVNVGRSFEQMALTATSLNVNSAHKNMPCEEVSVRQNLIQQLNLKNGKQPLLLIRLGYSEKMP